MRLLDLFVFKYNRTDFHELNIDWLISDVRTLADTLQNFISLNVIKYANPIQWNITTQYEANTVVVNANDGTAYLSAQAVPSGIAITNTDYWMPIFTLNLISANQNITLRDDGSNVLATFSSAVDDWLIWNGTLYKVSRAIAVNEAYVTGYNLTRYTIELFISDLKTLLLNTLNSITGDLSDLTTSDKSDLVAAINEVLNTLNSITGDLSDLTTSDKSDLVAAINELKHTSNFVTPEAFGAAGDGQTDDSAAFQDAIDYALSNKKGVIALSSYLLSTPVNIETNETDGFSLYFNKIRYTGSTGAPFIITGRTGFIKGSTIISSYDGLHLGNGTEGLMDFVIDCVWLTAAHDGIVMNPSTSTNIQYIKLSIKTIYYGNYGVFMDLTNRYIGEILFDNVAFATSTALGGTWAIYADCTNYGCTGLTMIGCSLESAHGGLKITNTVGSTSFRPLYMFNCRTSELSNNGYKLIDHDGYGVLRGDLFLDEISLDAFDIETSVATPASGLTIHGRIKRGSMSYDKAILSSGRIIPVLASQAYQITTDTSFTSDTLPDYNLIRSTANLTFSLDATAFSGQLIIYASAAITVTVNGTAFTLANNDMLYIESKYILGVGNRFFVSHTTGNLLINPV